jgi:hypothetical protein
MIRKIVIAGAVLLAGTLATAPAAHAAPAAFPAIGTYTPSPGVNLDGETVLADIVTITPAGLPRFVVLVQVTNTSSSVQTINCVLPNGHVKTASDSWMRIIRGNRRVTLKAVDSTCGEQPGFSDPLAPGQTGTYFVAFPLPPALGTRIQLSSLFGNSSGGVSRYWSNPFDPYAGTTGLQIVQAPAPPLIDFFHLGEDGWDLATTIHAIEVLGFDGETILDVNLIAPWNACPVGDYTCLQNELPTPYLPLMQNG